MMCLALARWFWSLALSFNHFMNASEPLKPFSLSHWWIVLFFGWIEGSGYSGADSRVLFSVCGSELGSGEGLEDVSNCSGVMVAARRPRSGRSDKLEIKGNGSRASLSDRGSRVRRVEGLDVGSGPGALSADRGLGLGRAGSLEPAMESCSLV